MENVDGEVRVSEIAELLALEYATVTGKVMGAVTFSRDFTIPPGHDCRIFISLPFFLSFTSNFITDELNLNLNFLNFKFQFLVKIIKIINYKLIGQVAGRERVVRSSRFRTGAISAP